MGGATTGDLYVGDDRKYLIVCFEMFYIYLTVNYRVRAIVSGIISTVAGSGLTLFNGENVKATSANINRVFGVAVDSSNGDLYFASYGNNRVQVVTKTTSLVSTYAGSGSAGDGGSATAASLNGPDGLCLSSTSNLYVAIVDDKKVFKITGLYPSSAPSAAPTLLPTPGSSNNMVYLVAGTGAQSTTGTGSFATSATLNTPRSVWMDSAGALYFTEQRGGCVRKVSSNIVIAFAGTSPITAGNGIPATSAVLNGPYAVYGDSNNNVYFTECYGNFVRKVSSLGIISLIAGTGSATESGNGGPATSAGVVDPGGIWLETTGVVYFTSYAGCSARSVSVAGSISRFAGWVMFIVWRITLPIIFA